MGKQNTGVLESLKAKISGKAKTENEERPVKWVKEAENVWRIVYAD